MAPTCEDRCFPGITLGNAHREQLTYRIQGNNALLSRPVVSTAVKEPFEVGLIKAVEGLGNLKGTQSLLLRAANFRA